MITTQLCPKCGSLLAADAPLGLCPKCLLQGGVASGLGETTPSPGAAGFVPPSVAELQQSFPQLEIIELLGRGGMGAVYKARQPGLDRFVALKVLPPQVGRDPLFAERFAREARALARLAHPNIVAVHDSGQAGGLYYFLMEYVDGTNLRQTMAVGALQPTEALAIVPQICDALQYAHDEGVVHRDIKPENILLDKKGRVKIADFGLSKLLGDDRLDVSITGTHQVMGTLRYMAPEQMKGTRTVDHRADIYSLGVVFYELLTGDLPMGRFDPPSQRVQVDVRLDEVVLRTLAQEPDKRYQRASEIKSSIVEIVSHPAMGVAQHVSHPSAIEKVPQPMRRETDVGRLVFGVLLLLTIPVLGLAAPFVARLIAGPTWVMMAAALVIFPALLCAAVLFISLGLRGKRTAPAPSTTGSSSSGTVVAVVAIILAVTCVPLGLVVLVALGVAVFWVTPHGGPMESDFGPTAAPHEAGDFRRSEERVTTPFPDVVPREEPHFP